MKSDDGDTGVEPPLPEEPEGDNDYIRIPNVPDLGVGDIPKPHLGSPTKEQTAPWIALGILGVWAVTLMLVLMGGFWLIYSAGGPDKAKAIIVDSAIPYLEKAGIFATSVFGPLLAFVLGYYFGKERP
jgi:hypothetical protein